MTPQEIRSEIYDYILHNVLPQGCDMKVWNKHRKEISSLLKKFGTAVNPTIIQTKPSIKKLSPKELQENDIKKGIWRPIEFYS